MAITGSDGEISLVDLDQGSGSFFDPDPATQAITGEWGICVDVDSAMNQGCPDQTMSMVMDGVIGCMDRQVSYYLCGLELDIKDGDPSTASIEGNFLYIPPRVLIAAGSDSDGDGIVTPAITCSDPIDCKQVRAHPSPPPFPPPFPPPSPPEDNKGFCGSFLSHPTEMSIPRAHICSRRRSSPGMCIVRLFPL